MIATGGGSIRGSWTTWLGLSLVVLVGFSLRAIPGITTDHWFAYDAAFHTRMTERALTGELAERDALRFHPIGIDITWHQPGGLYRLTATVQRALTLLDPDLATMIRFTTALWGALTALPIFLLAAGWWGSRWAGWVAALSMAVLPAHITRTAASVYRFDALGTLLIAGHVLAIAFALALAATSSHPDRDPARGWPRVAAWIGPGLTLFLLLGVWRASVAVLAADALILLIIAATATAGRSLVPIALSLCAGVLASAIYPYVRAQDLLLSRSVLPALWVLLSVAGISLGRLRPGRRGSMILAVVLGAIVLVTVLPARPFDEGEGVAVRALLARYGLAGVDPFAMRLYGYVQELSFPGPAMFARDGYFSAVGGLALVGILFLAAGLVRSERRGRMTPAGLFLGALFVVWVGGTLFFDRNKVFAAIPVAVMAGGAAKLMVGHRTRTRAALGILVVVGALGFTAAESARLASDLGRDVDDDARIVCEWVRRLPPDAALLTDWGNGYLIQTYGRRATATDGHLSTLR